MFHDNATVPNEEIVTAAQRPQRLIDRLDAEEHEHTDVDERKAQDEGQYGNAALWEKALNGPNGWKYREKFGVLTGVNKTTGEVFVTLTPNDVFLGHCTQGAPKVADAAMKFVKASSEEYEDITRRYESAKAHIQTEGNCVTGGGAEVVRVIRTYRDAWIAYSIMASIAEFESNGWYARKGEQALEDQRYQEKEERTIQMLRKAYVNREVFKLLMADAKGEGIQYLPKEEVNWQWEVKSNLETKARFAAQDMAKEIADSVAAANGQQNTGGRPSLI